MNIKSLNGPYKHVFMNDDEIAEALENMEKNELLNTAPSYVKDGPSAIKLVSFREKHLTHLKEHPKTNPQHYLSNLRAMIKIRP